MNKSFKTKGKKVKSESSVYSVPQQYHMGQRHGLIFYFCPSDLSTLSNFSRYLLISTFAESRVWACSSSVRCSALILNRMRPRH